VITTHKVHDFESWRNEARKYLEADISYEKIQWKSQDELSLFEDTPHFPKLVDVSIPRSFLEEAFLMAYYRDDSNWSLLYRIAWRLTHGERHLFEIKVDSDVIEFYKRLHSVTKDHHKMKAFVRFKEFEWEGKTIYVAWHRPDHKIFKLASKFFVNRFPNMDWMIFSEDESMVYIDQELKFGPGCPQNAINIQDDIENLWKTYYGSIFNPARIKIGMMKKEMAVRYWKSMPETALIEDLIADAPRRLKEFAEHIQPSARDLIDEKMISLEDLKSKIHECKACTICSKATAPVFGEGPEDARIVFVGEQPGDEEDKAQKPFIGPAGQVLNHALKTVNLDRNQIYVTNAVKGFKWNPKYGRREHRSAGSQEIAACKPWLKAELNLIKPEILVCLGRSAAQSVLGKVIKMEDVRGKFFKTSLSEKTIVIPHPSSILRTPDPILKEESLKRFIDEIQMIKDASGF
jgi:uracil-DNA glycosylase